MPQQAHRPDLQHERQRLYVRHAVGAALWCLLVLALAFWSSHNIETEMLGLARQEAVANFNKDQAFRIWGTHHGGVYVPVTERTTPSPYLEHIPERDLTTPSGRALTLMNPAYMLRQMMEDYDELYGVRGRITSLKPLNPGNAPDAWEQEALRAFERGEKERFEITTIDDKPYLRLIRPMMTTEGCLKCHRHQGYKVGDVRGGVGVSVPLQKYLNIAENRKLNLSSILGAVWLVGIGVIWVNGRRQLQRTQERLAYEARIWRQANFDTLTGLSNRNLFMDRLDRALAFARRENRTLALLYIDLDRFKDVNDTRGHAVGDRLLQEAAQRLRYCVREMDTVSRLGGDEFTVILPEIAEASSAERVATKILDELKRPFDLSGQAAHLSASIGITLFPQDGDNSGAMLKNADTAMYRAKAEGRNTHRYFTREMNRQAEDRVSLESALRLALKQQDFVLHYQPIVAVADGRLVGAEALIRWNASENGLRSPDEFIGVAEESGLIVPMGEWVLEQAAADLAALDKAGLDLKRLSVNVSTVQFRSTGFDERMAELLRQNPHLKHRLLLELTESVFLDEYGEPGRQLKTLQSLGLGVAIDDFGTGYSSLSYLKRFPVNIIKIDRSFIRDVTTDPEDAALCVAIIAMAHHLGLGVVAEGVESEAQWRFLQNNGCDFAQGYYFGRPMDLDRMLDHNQGKCLQA